MIYRKLDDNGDYILGQGRAEFFSGVEAVAQAIITHIKLLLGEWWEDVDNGTPLWQSMLGTPGTESNLVSIDNIIKDRILSTQLNGENLVSTIDNYERTYNSNTRSYSFKAEVTTIYSESVLIEQELSIG